MSSRTNFAAPSFVLLATLGSALVSGCGPQEADAQASVTPGVAAQPIVGGTSANIEDLPWQISFQSSSGSHFCGGSIIDANWILTAQHCVAGSSAYAVTVPSTVRIGAGSSNRNSMPQTRAITDIIAFPGYTDASVGKDVALLRLASPLTLGSGVKAIPLATPADEAAGRTSPGVLSTVSGWGTQSSGASTLPTTLQRVDVPFVSDADAAKAYSSFTPDQIGAGYAAGGKDSCQGDSGGPLVTDGANGKILAGVVSWGEGCAKANYPGMYARVATFQSWVSSFLTATPTAALSQTGLSVSKGAWKHFTLTVPSGAKALTVTASGGSGDGDLYVHTASPTSSSYTCRPYASGNSEYCSIANPRAGTWYVSVYAYSATSGQTLRASTY